MKYLDRFLTTAVRGTSSGGPTTDRAPRPEVPKVPEVSTEGVDPPLSGLLRPPPEGLADQSEVKGVAATGLGITDRLGKDAIGSVGLPTDPSGGIRPCHGVPKGPEGHRASSEEKIGNDPGAPALACRASDSPDEVIPQGVGSQAKVKAPGGSPRQRRQTKGRASRRDDEDEPATRIVGTWCDGAGGLEIAGINPAKNLIRVSRIWWSLEEHL